MTDYCIKYNGGIPVIVDESDQPISTETADLLLTDLLQHYKLKCSVYIAHSPSTGLYKIGMSRNVTRRMGEIQTTLVHEIKCQSTEVAWYREHALHHFYTWRGKHDDGEWFALDEDDLTRIRSISWTRLGADDGLTIMTTYSDVIMEEIRAEDGDAAVARVKEVVAEQIEILRQRLMEIEDEILTEDSPS